MVVFGVACVLVFAAAVLRQPALAGAIFVFSVPFLIIAARADDNGNRPLS